MNCLQPALLTMIALATSVLPVFSRDEKAYRFEQTSKYAGPTIVLLKPGALKCSVPKQNLEVIALESTGRVELVNRKTQKVAWEDIETWQRCGVPTIGQTPIVIDKASQPSHAVKVAGADCIENYDAAYLREIHLSPYMQKVVTGLYRFGIETRLFPVRTWEGSIGIRRKFVETLKIERLDPTNVQIAYERNYKVVPLMSIAKIEDNMHMAIDILNGMSPTDKVTTQK